jgi:hypothetical protein
MKLGTLVRWIIGLGALGWAGYVVAGAGWSYFTTQEIVDQVLRDVFSRNRSARGAGTQPVAVADYVRTAIALGAQREGMSVQESDVTVSVNSTRVSAVVHWPYPVISYRGNDILVIPMSIERSIVAPP